MRMNPRRLEARPRLAEQIGERLRRLLRRLDADDEFEALACGVVPGDAGLRLEKHRIDRLGLELAIEHQRPGLFAASSARICSP